MVECAAGATTVRRRHGVILTPVRMKSIKVAEAAGRTAERGPEDEGERVRATRADDRVTRAGERVVSGCGVGGGRGHHRAILRVRPRSAAANSKIMSATIGQSRSFRNLCRTETDTGTLT
jgi:hypothetical protein